MSPRTTGLLALVAVALGAFVYFYEIEGETAREAANQDTQNIYSGLEPEDVDAVSLQTLDGIPARFEKRDGIWWLVDPVVGRAEATALDGIVHALVNLPREGSVSTGESLGAFRLGPDAPTIRFEAGGVTRGLRIGRTTPVGGHRYVARLGDDEVAYVESYRVNAFNRNLADLRDRRIFDFEAGTIETIRLVWPEPTRDGAPDGGRAAPREGVELALARAADGRWHLGKPIAGLADQETLRDLLSNLAFLRVEKFVDAPNEEIRTALAETAFEFHWTLEGEHLERHARIAGAVGGQRVFESAGGRVDLISGSRLEEFPRSLVQYRFRRLAEFVLADARRVEMSFSATSEAGSSEVIRAVATLEAAGWRGTDSAGGTIRADAVSSALATLSNLNATDIFAEQMGSRELASLGLDPPYATIDVKSRPGAASEAELDPAGEDSLASLRFGRPYSGRGVFAQRSDSSTVFLVDPAVIGDVPTSAARYREIVRARASDEQDPASLVDPSLDDSESGFDPDSGAESEADDSDAFGEDRLP